MSASQNFMRGRKAPICGLCGGKFRKGVGVTVTSFGTYGGLRDDGFVLGPMTLHIANHSRCESQRREKVAAGDPKP